MAGLQIGNGVTVGIGSLPHRDLDAGVRFALDATAIPTIPSLARRSPAEGIIVQAMLGIEGVTVGQYGGHLGRHRRRRPDRDGDDRPPARCVRRSPSVPRARRRTSRRSRPGPIDAVKWQLVGPVTLGHGAVARRRAAARCVRGVGRVRCGRTCSTCSTRSRRRCPAAASSCSSTNPTWSTSPTRTSRSRPTRRSTSCRVRSPRSSRGGMSGLHVCGVADWSSMIATGPEDPVDPGRRLDRRVGGLPAAVPRPGRHRRLGCRAHRRPDLHHRRAAVASAHPAVVPVGRAWVRPRDAAHPVPHHARVRARDALGRRSPSGCTGSPAR